MSHLAHIALIVRDYDEALAFYVGRLGFTLVEDTHQPAQDKRWVVIRPPGAPANATTILLARASTPEQAAFIGDQAGGRVFLFLATDDFARDHAASPPPGSNGSAHPPITTMAASRCGRIFTAISGTWCSSPPAIRRRHRLSNMPGFSTPKKVLS